MKNSIAVILLSLLLNCSMNSFSQKIGQAKSAVKNSSSESNHRGSGRSYSSSRSGRGDDSFSHFFGDMIIRGCMTVFYYTAIGDYDHENHLHSNLTRFPMYNGTSGNYEKPDTIPVTVKYLRVDVDNQFLYSSQYLTGNHLKIKIRPMHYFYLQGDFFQLGERDQIFNQHSNLSLYNFNVCYDRIRFERFNLGWTLGVNYIGNEVNEAGFSYGLNAELFAAKNVSFFCSAKWGAINNAVVNEFQLESKYHIKRFFVALGFEHVKIGIINFDFISFIKFIFNYF